MKITLITLVLCLLTIFFQDWRYRKIHIALPVLILVFCFLSIDQRYVLQLRNMAYNMAFFLTVLGILVVYMSIKNKQFLNPFDNYFGLGDLLFYLTISPLFLLNQYIIFFILSMLFSIILQLLLKKFIKEKTVPLAGFSALLLLLVIVNDTFLNFKQLTLL